MRKYLFLFITLFFYINCFGQTDSARTSDTEHYDCLRFGIGYQKAIYTEIGYSHIIYEDHGLNVGSYGFYTAGELNFARDNGENLNYYGLKLGFETCWMIAMWAVELKFLTGNSTSRLLFTPKVGLSLFGAVNVLYGYNLPDKQLNLPGIINNQISLTVNFNRQFIGK